MESTRIMIVEDEAIIRKDLEEMVLGFGAEVVSTPATAEDAVLQTEETRPDLILMDIVLKGPMDGIEAAEQIGERFQTPVIFLTAYADTAKLKRAKLDNTFGYIVKPVNESKLICAIEIALYKHQLERGLHDKLDEYESFNPLLLKREIRIRELRNENQMLKRRLRELTDKAPETAP